MRSNDNLGFETIHDISELTNDLIADTELTGETDAQMAWRALCAALPRAMQWPDKRRIAWSRSHYGDPNAHGTISLKGDIPCIYAGDPDSGRVRRGGQNSGVYGYDADADDCLCFGADGVIYEIESITGSWSHWRGSTSKYRYSWRLYGGPVSDAVLMEATEAVRDALADHVQMLRARHVAGAAFAAELLAALKTVA